MGVGKRFFLLRGLKQILLSKPCAILYLFKDGEANPTPLNNFLILFVPKTVSKHKIQLVPSKVRAILYLLKERVANPHLLKYKFFKISLKK